MVGIAGIAPTVPMMRSEMAGPTIVITTASASARPGRAMAGSLVLAAVAKGMALAAAEMVSDLAVTK